jgi:hypothetical protein
MTEIGKIDKPEIKKYRNKKKIYFVKNLYLPQNATDKYKSIFDRYWDEVEEHLAKLEKAGKISKIFCESIYMPAEEAIKVIKAMNVRLEQIVIKRTEAGAELLALESGEIFGAYVDWNNCLMVTRTSRVHGIIHSFLQDEIRDRFAYIKTILDENITDGEAVLLIMREEDRDRLELPDHVEFFQITPPAYDDLLRYMSDADSGTEYWRS